MARVSIGVPVYNGVSLIQESLDCIASQSFRDIEVIISDNGSTDGTSKICAEFVAKDSRFKYIRHDKVMDVMLNFAFVRDQAKSPLFMWRAYDDLSSHNYIEELVKVFDQAPETLLAVGNVSQETGGKKCKKMYSYNASNNGLRILRILSQLFRGHASWFYGLWCHAACVEVTTKIYSIYPDSWAADHLTLFHCVMRDGIRGTKNTTFKQRIIAAERGPNSRFRPSYREIKDRNERFASLCRSAIDGANLNGGEKKNLHRVLPLYVNKRCHGLKRALQAKFRRNKD
jgi:glycosyltransferase involved in cell wall biosynthesis